MKVCAGERTRGLRNLDDQDSTLIMMMMHLQVNDDDARLPCPPAYLLPLPPMRELIIASCLPADPDPDNLAAP